MTSPQAVAAFRVQALERSRFAVGRLPAAYGDWSGCASCILANLALQLGRTLTWDAENGRVRDDEEANRLLRRPYRRPWIPAEVETA